MVAIARILHRLEMRCYNKDHEVFRCVTAAYDALHTLRIRAHYASCAGATMNRRDDLDEPSFEAGAGI